MMLEHVLTALMLAGASAPHAAERDPAAPSAEEMLPYLSPQQMVDVGGRRLNLVCMGSGDQTVLFDSGGSDWSSTWALIQPAVARRARACTYDRAGLGYSDPANGPRTPIAIVQDLRKLIEAGGLKGPVVLVGHSLGGFHVKLYATLYPEGVAGLVLVDPSEERSNERTRDLTTRRYGAAVAARLELADQSFGTWLMDRYRTCADAARSGDMDPASITYRRCSDPVRPRLGPEIAAERLKLQVKPTYQTAQASEILNSVYGDLRGDPVYARLFRPGVLGSRPLVVLTHGAYDASDPDAATGQTQWIALHRETTRLSRRGEHRIVPDANHNIQIDAPEAIVAAVNDVLDQLARSSQSRRSGARAQ